MLEFNKTVDNIGGDMDSAIGRWVSGADFFDRQSELAILEDRVRGGNHTLLTGQRRNGEDKHRS